MCSRTAEGCVPGWGGSVWTSQAPCLPPESLWLPQGGGGWLCTALGLAGLCTVSSPHRLHPGGG